MKTYVSKTTSCCFNVLHKIRSIRRLVYKSILLSLAPSLVCTHLDYGSTNLAGISSRLLDRLQSVLNAAVQLLCDGRKYDHISPLLRYSHCLQVLQRIKFHLAVLIYYCRNHTASEYLSRDLQKAANSDSCRWLRSSSTHKLIVPWTRLKTVGGRTFGVAAAWFWNDLPSTVVRLITATFHEMLKNIFV